MKCPLCDVKEYVCVECQRQRDASTPHCWVPWRKGFICGDCYEPPFVAVGYGTSVIRNPRY